MARFEAEDVLVAPVHDYAAVFDDPQVAQRPRAGGRHRRVGTVKFVGMPITLSDTPARLTLRPPKIGEHNDEVLPSGRIPRRSTR